MSEVSVACGARICVRVVTGSNNKAATDAAMLQLEPAVMCCVWVGGCGCMYVCGWVGQSAEALCCGRDVLTAVQQLLYSKAHNKCSDGHRTGSPFCCARPCLLQIDLVNKHGVNCPPPQTPARLLDKLVRS
eukprot:936443-Pelagomonas_calceolata.AAC.1